MPSPDKNLLKLNILKALTDLSDLEWQKKAWSGQLPNVVSCPSEVVNCIYDFGFEEYMEELKIVIPTSAIVTKMIELDIMLEAYSKITMSDEKVLRDPNWHLITQKASEVKTLLT